MSFDSILHAYFAAFGLISLFLAVIGFVRAKSKASLIAGGLSGILLLIASYLSGQTGQILGTVVSFLLAGRFLPATLKTKKLYPTGLIALLALTGLILGTLILTKVLVLP